MHLIMYHHILSGSSLIIQTVKVGHITMETTDMCTPNALIKNPVTQSSSLFPEKLRIFQQQAIKIS